MEFTELIKDTKLLGTQFINECSKYIKDVYSRLTNETNAKELSDYYGIKNDQFIILDEEYTQCNGCRQKLKNIYTKTANAKTMIKKLETHLHSKIHNRRNKILTPNEQELIGKNGTFTELNNNRWKCNGCENDFLIAIKYGKREFDVIDCYPHLTSIDHIVRTNIIKQFKEQGKLHWTENELIQSARAMKRRPIIQAKEPLKETE